MTVFLVTYELVSEANRTAIVKVLHEFPSWSRLSHNVYAVSTPLVAEQIYCQLSPVLDFYDRVYIIAVQHPFAGMGVDRVDRWLDRHLPM
ncbi:hypothetical protein G7048_19050 [Diaphorobacter sp. HDW4B]|uniref:hypothetical protein n=1 Tax=Diaphorobacter sp. HDW4B TaxID=2714925 RepID=UPI00140D1650|nr:hypothetical protein [Diaphorobacter sp. HDW4B]QIL72265.1 hypothetical protein G7048_19050 [Diaphorobacter sp. HDW4B]